MLSFQEEMYKESNTAAIQFAKSSIQYSFFLNGAAATALFAKTGSNFIAPACVFAGGAALATVSMAIAYIVQIVLCETWVKDGPYYDFVVWDKAWKISRTGIEKWRTSAMILWFFSILLFIVAAIWTLRV